MEDVLIQRKTIINCFFLSYSIKLWKGVEELQEKFQGVEDVRWIVQKFQGRVEEEEGKEGPGENLEPEIWWGIEILRIEI